MPKITLEELIERCLWPAWQVDPCEVFCDLEFPDSKETCKGNCVNCLLVASGHEQIYTP